MAFSGGSGDPYRLCKRVTVILCAMAHVVVTLYVLRALLDRSSRGSVSSSSLLADCMWGLNPCRLQLDKLKNLQEVKRKEAIESRRESAPLQLMQRVKEIEAEVAMYSQGQNTRTAIEKSEQEELQEQVEIEYEVEGPPAVEDDELGVIERLLPPEKCHPEPNTDFGGVAVRWGLTHHVNTPAECCKACSWQAAYARVGQRKCNVWVFCPVKTGCPSPDGYEHKFGECWLKQADQPLAIVRDYSCVMRVKKEPPLPVLWISGVTPSSNE